MSPPPTSMMPDHPEVQRKLALLYDSYVASGAAFPLERFGRALEPLVASSPEPELVLAGLLRFAEASFSRAALFTDLVQVGPFLDLLVRLFGHSRFLADILVREPGLFRWLTSSHILESRLAPEALRDELLHLLSTFSRPERQIDAVKRVYRREILRIAARDLMGTADLREVTASLAALADAIAEAVLAMSREQLEKRFGPGPASGFAVIGLGKLGGAELNYSSDIDILVVYGEEGTFLDPSGRAVTHHEYFNQLAEVMIRQLSGHTAEGYLYRVDTRLRPESGGGPLARSLQSCLVYYESRGELWERQMLIKARPMAGDKVLARQFIDLLQPFVYPRTFFQHPMEAIARIKARIEAKVGDAANVKLRPGGIRDIEFIVQALQLLNGGRQPNLRQPNTLDAIEALAGAGFLTAGEASVLRDAYLFLRTLEHRLQIMQNTQTHTLPDGAAELDSLARRMGLPGGEELLAHQRRHLAGVRSIFDQVMLPKQSTSDAGLREVIEGSVGEEAAHAVLRGYGLNDMQGGLRALRRMAGTGLAGFQESDGRSRTAFIEQAPALFLELQATPDPDFALQNLSLLVSSSGAPGQLLAAMADPHFRRLLVTITSTGIRLTRVLARSPLLFEQVVSDIGFVTAPVPGAIPPGMSLTTFKAVEELRAGLRHVLGFSTLPEFFHDISAIADLAVLAAIQDQASHAPLAVFALGKYGSGELSLDADLDLVFLSAAGDATGQDEAEERARGIVRMLTAVSAEGTLYDVDTRLRPEGKNAPLVADIAGYRDYLHRRASLWERQSLTRLRWIGGDAALGARVSALVTEFIHGTPLPADWVQQIATMRKRMETRTRTRGEVVDLKVGAGGMVDVEFLVQMLQLRFGGANPRMRGMRVLDLLEADWLPLVSPRDRAFLHESYLFLRRVETMLRLTLEERTTVLPEGPPLETLAQCVARMRGEEFLRAITDRMTKTRTLFDTICGLLAEKP